MTKTRIAVGSTRKPKLKAVEEALSALRGQAGWSLECEIVAREVQSGVNHTPLSREECMRGARQRAEALRDLARQENERWDYFVGLEGGLDSLADGDEARVLLESWAYVSDGTIGHFGRSGGIELPQELAREVFARGVELSVAIDRYAGEAGIRDGQGAWGVLSGSLISRQEAFRVALIAAFAPFYNGAMYRRAAAAG